MTTGTQRQAGGGELAPAEQLGVMLSEGAGRARSGSRIGDAITHARAPRSTWPSAPTTGSSNWRSTTCSPRRFTQAGRFEEALEARERHFALHREIFNDAADLRLRTLQIAHDNATARHQMEITKLKTVELVTHFAADHIDPDAYHLEAFERLAALAEMRGGNTTRHTERGRRPGGRDRPRHRPAARVV